MSLLARIADLGPFFAVQQHANPAPAPPWRRLVELVDNPAILADRIARTRAYLGAASGQDPAAIEPRVAASVTHLGMVARLISPALAAVVLEDRVPNLTLDQLHWQPVLGGTFPLSLPPIPPAGGDLHHELFDGPLPAIAQAFDLSDHILVGNVASAVNGAATALSNAAPTLATRARAVATALLDVPPLRDAHTSNPFRRRSCCLIYRAAPDHNGPLCGDCVLNKS
ncbi:(2Fe-2S)-binding protein [Kribbella sp. GL6]|uniref:(2Fe-2S)-binding protein n=1 Tax=Kribbella sp. GL6 TaxID=3419765 RepID=UPI003D037862